MVESSQSIQASLLFCGILGLVIYVGTDLVAGNLLKGYNFTSQSMSELSATGASTRMLVLALQLPAYALLIAFALGVWGTAGQNVLARLAAMCIAGNAALGAISVTFFPLRGGVVATISNSTANVSLGATALLCLLLAIGLGAAAYRNWFGYYSIATLGVFAGLAILRLLVLPVVIPGLQQGSTTGAQERTIEYAYLLWLSVLSIALR